MLRKIWHEFAQLFVILLSFSGSLMFWALGISLLNFLGSLLSLVSLSSMLYFFTIRESYVVSQSLNETIIRFIRNRELQCAKKNKIYWVSQKNTLNKLRTYECNRLRESYYDHSFNMRFKRCIHTLGKKWGIYRYHSWALCVNLALWDSTYNQRLSTLSH